VIGRRAIHTHDVVPLTLRVKTKGGLTEPLIHRNTPIPTSASKVFTTTRDGQREIPIVVLQGESELAQHCKVLQTVTIHVEAAPMGVAQVEVTFDIDANGILNVSASDLATGRTRSTVVTGSHLDPEEAARIVQEAQVTSAEDAKVREQTMLRNKFTRLRRWATKALEQGDMDGPCGDELAALEMAKETCEKKTTEESVGLLQQAYDVYRAAVQTVRDSQPVDHTAASAILDQLTTVTTTSTTPAVTSNQGTSAETQQDDGRQVDAEDRVAKFRTRQAKAAEKQKEGKKK
jgi:molecular chaperone DnaK